MRSNSRLLYVLAASLSVMGTLLVACFVLHRESTQDMSTAFQLGNGAKQTDAGRSMLQQLPPHFSLDTSCARNSSDRVAQERRQEFDQIFDTGYWGKTESRSGEGSSLEGAFDWIKLLRAFFRRFRVQSIADIPCGDTYWQFSLQEINAIEDLYFGGDISMRVIDHNQQRYQSKHYNKLFHYWDLVQCPVPTFTHRNSTHERKGNRFDLIMVRDALQHMHIQNGLKAVRNLVMSGAKYVALSSYPPHAKAERNPSRAIDKNESLPRIPSDCAMNNYCQLGSIKDGAFYRNNINCAPFNFPLNKAILVQPSHQIFKIDSDEIHIYPIDDELKQIVQEYDGACK